MDIMDIYQLDNKAGMLSQVQVTGSMITGFKITGLWANYVASIDSQSEPYTLKGTNVIFVGCWISDSKGARNGSNVTFEATSMEPRPLASNKVSKTSILP